MSNFGPSTRLVMAQGYYIKMLQSRGELTCGGALGLLRDIHRQLHAKDGGISSENNPDKGAMLMLMRDAARTYAEIIGEIC